MANFGRRRDQIDLSTSGPDGVLQRSNTEQLDHPLHVVGEYREAHFGSDFFERPREEGRTSSPRLECAKDMFDGLTAQAHGIGLSVEPILHGIEHGLMRHDQMVLRVHCHLHVVADDAGATGRHECVSGSVSDT